MKAISLWQPWASLWACGRKTYETRHWAPSYRGELLVHAAKKICVDDISDELHAICEDEFGGHWAFELPRGALIARCTLVDCIRTEQLNISPTDEEDLLSNFEPGRFGWKSAGMTLLERPIPWRGMQSLFEVALPGEAAPVAARDLFS